MVREQAGAFNNQANEWEKELSLESNPIILKVVKNGIVEMEV